MFPITEGSLTINKVSQHRTFLNNLCKRRGGFVKFRPVSPPSSNGGLTQFVIGSVPTRLRWSQLFDFFMSKVFSALPYTFIQPFVPLTKSLHCCLSMHFTFASLSSSDLALHAYLIPCSHLMQDLIRPFDILHKTRVLFCRTFSILTLHMSKPLQILPIYSFTHLLSYTNSERYFLILQFNHPGHIANTPQTLRSKTISLRLSSILIPKFPLSTSPWAPPLFHTTPSSHPNLHC